MVVLLALLPAWAGASGEGAGTLAFDFLRLPAEPVGRSLSGAHVASVTGPAAGAWNPAGYARTRTTEALLAHTTWIAETSLEWGAVSLALPEGWGTVGLCAGMLRTGALDGYAADGTPTGSFLPLQATAVLGYGRAFGSRWSAGVSLETALEGDGEHSPRQAWAGGMGVQLHLGVASFGVSAVHLTTSMKAGDERFLPPTTLRAGSTLHTSWGLDIHAAVEGVVREDPKFLLAATWQPARALAAHAGLRLDNDRPGEAAQPSFGISVDAGPAQLTYGVQPSAEFATSHQISLSVPLARRQ